MQSDTKARILARIAGAAFLAGAAPIVMSGCDDGGPAEEIGEDIDDAVDDAGDAIEDAADDVEDAIDDATDDEP